MQQQAPARLRHHADDIVVEHNGLLDVAVRARRHDRGANDRMLEEGDALDRFGRVLADIGRQGRRLDIPRRRWGYNCRIRRCRRRLGAPGLFGL
ncbi:hypothetical protein D3C81_2068500 [compost metagenome]